VTFTDDDVRVARNREPGQKLAVIAKDFGISEPCLTNWMRQADVESELAADGMPVAVSLRVLKLPPSNTRPA
jgi:transposase-like protein